MEKWDPGAESLGISDACVACIRLIPQVNPKRAQREYTTCFQQVNPDSQSIKRREKGPSPLNTKAGNILYLPKSSGLRFSSHSFHLSVSSFSSDTSIFFACVTTFSVTKMGAFTRSAKAIASLGRASMVITLPL